MTTRMLRDGRYWYGVLVGSLAWPFAHWVTAHLVVIWR
jgi:hypothetical protein